MLSAVPYRDEYLSLIVGVDQTDQIAQHDTVFVAEAGAGQDHRRVMRVIQMQGDAAGNQFALAGANGHATLDAGAQVDAGRTGRGISGRVLVQARIQHFDVHFLHFYFPFL